MIYDLQRANMWKRISAWLLDAILLCIIATLMALLLSSALGYDKYSQQLDARYAYFEAEYGVSRNITQAQVDVMSPEDLTKLEAASRAIAEDEEALAAALAEYPVVISVEIGGGVVPADKKQREARERAGRLACLLAERADTVVRLCCGLPEILKGELP